MTTHAPALPVVDRRFVIPKIVYFCFFAAGSALMPYLALYYNQIGLDARVIGLLAGIPPLVTLVAAPLWGGLADLTRRHRQLLLVAMGGTVITVLILSTTVHLYLIVPLVILYAFFVAPIMPLVDNSVLVLLGKQKDLYGKQRVWGAIGWGCSAAAMGFVISRMGLDLAFYGYALFMTLGLLAASRLRVSRASISVPFVSGLRTLLVQRRWLVFLTAILTAGVAAGMYHSFLFLYLDSLGASTVLMGLSLVVATFSEIPVFFFSDRLLGRFGARGLLLIAMAAAAVRMFAYSVMIMPWQVIMINLLHGLTFSAMWAAGVAMGVAAAVGAMLGGLLFESVGPQAMFRVGGYIVLLGLIFYLVAGRR